MPRIVIPEQKFMEILTAGVTRACEDIETRAQGYAPVSRSKSRRGAVGRPVEVRPLKQFKGGTLQARRAAREALLTKVENLDFGENARELQSGKLLKSFRFKVGPNRGRSPAFIEPTARGGLRGFTARQTSHRGGTLRDSIKFDGVTVSGRNVEGTVTAHAPYSYWVEYGFNHSGGRYHKGAEHRVRERPFMRKALQEVAVNFRKGAYFRR